MQQPQKTDRIPPTPRPSQFSSDKNQAQFPSLSVLLDRLPLSFDQKHKLQWVYMNYPAANYELGRYKEGLCALESCLVNIILDLAQPCNSAFAGNKKANA